LRFVNGKPRIPFRKSAAMATMCRQSPAADRTNRPAIRTS
jgi:hypothetical protein